MYTIEIPNFNIEQIARSGQCFRMSEIEPGYWQIIAKDKCVIIYQKDNQVFFSCSEDEFDNFWKTYFDLDYDYGHVINTIDSLDTYLNKCADFGSGIRILKQDLWEMLITFMISQNNNIPRIKNSVKKLCEYAGEKKHIEVCMEDEKGNTKDFSIDYYAFPSPEDIASVPVSTLHSFGLGYRDEYLNLTSTKISNGEYELSPLLSMSYEEAMKYLMTLKGVGKKVADCVCLFGLHHISAFPIDTHIKQILAEHYPDGFPFEKYEGYAGILQQYMFFAHL